MRFFMWIAFELKPILCQFPEARNKIIQLFDNDLNFRSMCEDYWVCITLLQRCSSSQDDLLKKEYQSMRMILEKEVNDYLKRN